jgi:hypothetical protein
MNKNLHAVGVPAFIEFTKFGKLTLPAPLRGAFGILHLPRDALRFPWANVPNPLRGLFKLGYQKEKPFGQGQGQGQGHGHGHICVKLSNMLAPFLHDIVTCIA